MRYWTPLSSYAGASRLPFIYVLRTGRFWKTGRIGSVDVIVRARGIPFEAIREAYPETYTLDKDAREVRWSMRDHAPTEDIGLLISPLAILAQQLGQRVLDPIDVHEGSFEDGAFITVSGTPDFQPFEQYQPLLLQRLAISLGLSSPEARPRAGYLRGERVLDANIVIPDGIRPMPRQTHAARLRLVLRPEVTESRREVPLFHGGWWKILAGGHVRHDADGLYLDVVEWTLLERREPAATTGAETLFPWVSGRYWFPKDTTARELPSSWRAGDKPGSRHAHGREPEGVRARVPHDA